MMIPMMMLASTACRQQVEKVPAIDMTDMDLTVSPGDDFFQYANGGWIKKNPLKPEYARFGSFDVLRENNVVRLNDLFAEMARMTPEAGTVDQKIVDLYKQGLDSVKLNAEGGQPLQKYLDAIYAAKDKKALAMELAEMNKYGEGGFFSIGVQADLMDSKMQVLYLAQSGLGMGDRDYYVDPANAELHKGYTAMLAKLFALSGYEDAAQKAENAVAVEDRLAEVSWTSVQNRDYTKQYNPNEHRADLPPLERLRLRLLLQCPRYSRPGQDHRAAALILRRIQQAVRLGLPRPAQGLYGRRSDHLGRRQPVG